MAGSTEIDNLTIASLVEHKKELEVKNIKLEAQLELMKELFIDYCIRR